MWSEELETNVILSKRSASKDLRTEFSLAVNEMPRSLDSLRSLGMTAFFKI